MNVLIADDDPMFPATFAKTAGTVGICLLTVSDGWRHWRNCSARMLRNWRCWIGRCPGWMVSKSCRSSGASRSQPYTYVLLLTAKHKKCEVIEALRAGCDDCLSKPFDPEELQARLFVGKRILALESRLTDALKTTQYQASHDTLTGISNRGAVLEALQRELQRGSRQQDLVSVIMLDLDHFKTVNDTFGHLAGDQVLQEVAARVKGSCAVTIWRADSEEKSS